MLYYIWDNTIPDYVECSVEQYNSHKGLRRYESYVLEEGETILDIRAGGRQPDYSHTSYPASQKKLRDYDPDIKPIKTHTSYKKQREVETRHILNVDIPMFIGISETYDTESIMFDLPKDNRLYKIARLLKDEFICDEELLFRFLTTLVAASCPYLDEHASACREQRLIWLTANETYQQGGICSEQSLVLQSIMKYLGYHSAVSRPFKNHVAVLVLANDGNFYELDTTFKKVTHEPVVQRIKGKETYGYVREGPITLDEVETGHKKAALYRRENGRRICEGRGINYEDTLAVLDYEYERANERRISKRKKVTKTKEKQTVDKKTEKKTNIPIVSPKRGGKEFEMTGPCHMNENNIDDDVWVSPVSGLRYTVSYDETKNITTFTPIRDTAEENYERIDINKGGSDVEEFKKLFGTDEAEEKDQTEKPKWGSKNFPPGIIREYCSGIESIQIIRDLADTWKRMDKNRVENWDKLSDKIKDVTFIKKEDLK